MVQWLRPYIPNAQGTSSIPGWGIKILHAAQHGQKNNNNKFKKKGKDHSTKKGGGGMGTLTVSKLSMLLQEKKRVDELF